MEEDFEGGLQAAGRLGGIILLSKILEVALISLLESPISEQRVRKPSAYSLTFWFRISSIAVKPLAKVYWEEGVKFKPPLGTGWASDIRGEDKNDADEEFVRDPSTSGPD